MFAIAWKEYRQIRLVALLLVAVLLIIHFVVGFTPWSDVRSGLIPISVGIIISVCAALAFAEEKPSGTYLFLSALPLGRARRWLGKAAVNLLLTAATLVLFVTLAFLLDRDSFQEFRGKGVFDAEELCMGAGVLFTLWSAAVFYSSAFERSVVAMLFTWGTLGAVVYAIARMEHARFFNSYGAWPRSVAHAAFLVVIFSLLGVVCLTFLVGSLLFERKMPRRLRLAEKLAGILAVLIVAAGLSLLVTSSAIAWAIRYGQQHPEPHDARTVFQLGTARDDGSLLAFRRDALYRCTPSSDWQKGKWRRYAIGPGRAITEVGRGWVISGGGKTLAFMREVPKSVAEVAGGILRIVFLNRHWEFFPHRGRLGLLDLDTGEVVFPEALRNRDLVVMCASWQGDPSRLYCLVDEVRPRGHHRPGNFYYVKESKMFVFSKEGELLDKRDVEEIDAFRDRRRRLSWETPGIGISYPPNPRMEGAKVSVPRYSSSGMPRSIHSGAVLLYDIETGRTRQRVVEHPEEHIAFSPSLDWEIAFVDSNRAGWRMDFSRHTHQFTSNELQAVPAGTYMGGPAPAPAPPWPTLLGPDGQSADILRFTEGLEAASVRYQFLNDEKCFVAFVIEYASSQKNGFEHAGLEDASVSFSYTRSAQQFFEWRRVRAIGIDLETMERSEVDLPAGMTRFLAGPGGKRLFFHNAGYSSVYRRSCSTDCLVLEAPGLKKLGAYEWPDGVGPGFGPPGLWGTFLDADTHAATVSGWKADILIWTVGHERPVPIIIPRLPAESEG